MTQPTVVPADLDQTGQTSAPAGYAWVVLFVVFMASVAAPLNQFKVPPMMPVLIDTFRVDLTMAGLLMSIFAVTGFILAIPGGFIFQKLGAKVTGLMAAGCLVIGAVLGALSTTAGLLLTSRVIEGVGMGLIAVVAPAVIAMWFPAERRGTPMGLWATWVPVGSVLMFNLAPALGLNYGWQAVSGGLGRFLPWSPLSCTGLWSGCRLTWPVNQPRPGRPIWVGRWPIATSGCWDWPLAASTWSCWP
jgi:MFS family permease